MRKIVVVALLLACPGLATAQPKPAFEGLGMTLTKETDPMTDAQVCKLTVDQGSWGLVIHGPTSFGIFAMSEKLLFAPDDQHLIRVGTEKAIPLVHVPKRNALVVVDPAAEAAVVRAVVAGQEIKIRYFTFPDHKYTDAELHNPNVSYGYQQGVKMCGWKSVGGTGDLVPPKISVYTSKEKEHDGYASVTVEGNTDLGLKKNFDSSGGGCYLNLGIESLFGMKKGQWVSDKVDLLGRMSVVIRAADGSVQFSAKLPKNYNRKDVHGAHPFPEGEAAARIAWKLDPTGTIELDPPDRYSKLAMLYGFRELWNWGVQNCGFPPVG